MTPTSSRRLLLLISLCLWLLSLLMGVVLARLGVRSQVPFWGTCFASGLLAVFGTKMLMRSEQRETPWSAAIGPLAMALVGLWQLFNGDRSGLMVYLMFSGVAVGAIVDALLARAAVAAANRPVVVEKVNQ
jgi:hypothetical protein